MKKYLLLVIAGIASFPLLHSQSLFESSLGNQGDPANSRLVLSGFTRGAGFVGLIKDQDPLLRSAYGETALQIKARGGTWGQAYTDIRFRAGSEFGSGIEGMEVREAYADLYAGKVQIRAGKQISSWGRADGINPTDNLTPKNYFTRSSDPDDMRLGNYILRGQLRPWNFLKIEVDIVPWYVPSRYRFDLIDLPSFVSISDVSHPGFVWDKTTAAAKLDLVLPAVEGSVSWFSGYDALPVLRPGALPAPPFNDFNLQLLQVPFRQQTVGADFATIILKTGIRGEIAWKKPGITDTEDPLLPEAEFQWVVSLDREFGPVRLILGYNGKYIPDFTPADPPQEFDPAMLTNPAVWPLLDGLLTSSIGYYNRILFDQTDQWSHALLVRPSIELFHETLGIEVNSLINFTTEEYMVYPKISWHLSDGVLAVLGYQFYDGPDNTRFSWIKNALNGPFFELRITY